MIIYLLLPLFLVGFAYAGLNFWLFLQLRRDSKKHEQVFENKTLSILVCARNEQEQIAACLDALLAQNYPKELLEIWVADDRSTDRTPEILLEYTQKHPETLRILRIDHCPLGLSPKKNALTQIIQKAKGEILLNTDADCIAPANWAKIMVSKFADQVHMVLGRSDFADPAQGRNSFWGFQALDFISHGIVAAAGIAGGIPINSTGNSLAYRKSSFEAVGGLASVSHIASGDDDLILHKFHRHFPKGIRYCYDVDAAVHTDAPITFTEFWEQRKRWASKTVYYSPQTIVLLASVFAFYLAILTFPVLAILFGNLTLLWAGVALGGIKFVADAFPLFQGMSAFGRMDLARYYPITAFLHAPYIVAAAAMGVLGKFTWKDGAVSRQG